MNKYIIFGLIAAAALYYFVWRKKTPPGPLKGEEQPTADEETSISTGGGGGYGGYGIGTPVSAPVVSVVNNANTNPPANTGTGTPPPTGGSGTYSGTNIGVFQPSNSMWNKTFNWASSISSTPGIGISNTTVPTVTNTNIGMQNGG